MKALFVTSNEHKVREVSAILGIELERANLDIAEIQGLDVGEVAAAKARTARGALESPDTPVIVEDAGLAVEAWDGFPGALTKWLMGSVGPEGISRMLSAYADRSARAVCAVAVADGESVEVFRGEVHGIIASQPRGEHGFGFDPIFIPEGQNLTYAELGEEKHEDSHRARAFRAARRWLVDDIRI